MARQKDPAEDPVVIPIDGGDEVVETDPETDRVEAAQDPVVERPEPEPMVPASRVEWLENHIVELEKKLEATYSAHRVREQEMGRIRERLERDREKRLLQEKNRLFEQLLEPLDNLERSLQAADLSGDLEALLEGVNLVHKGILKTFHNLGLERFGDPGERFDPEIHDAISVAPVASSKEHDRIHMVYLPGYRIGDTIIRPARVVVGKHS
jgi:molecular chaperone GrpE